MKLSLPTHLWILGGLMALGLFLRFYNLDWGAPFYFHPDERNIASSISQLQFPTQMNPNFFAYGSLPLYVFYFTGLLLNVLTVCHFSLESCPVTFEQAIITSRFYSAVFSVLLIPLLYIIGRNLYNTSAGIMAAALATFSVGFIQYAHYGTTEMWLTFFSTLFLALLLQAYKKTTYSLLFFLALVAGALISAKISTVLLVALPLPILFLSYHTHTRSLLKALAKTIFGFAIFLFLTGVVFFLTNPYVLMAPNAFLGSMQYESGVATGTLPVFYTQEFTNTTPIIFQVAFVYPFLLNPLLTILFLPAVVILALHAAKKRSVNEALVLLFFTTLFISQAVLFVKWTRYMVPTLPFIYLILASAGFLLAKKFHLLRRRAFLYAVFSFVLVTGCVFSFSFLITVFGSTDTRIQAAAFAKEQLPQDQHYLSEVYDLGITPFNPLFPSISLFNFYDLEAGNPEATPEKLTQELEKASYIILPSQRLLKTRLIQKEAFPQGHAFYAALYNEVGYRKIYETPCDIFCRITYFGDPIFAFEETANVFDRPSVQIYQKL